MLNNRFSWKKCFLNDFLTFISMSVPVLSDLIVLGDPSFSVEANTLGSRLEKDVCSSQFICSKSWGKIVIHIAIVLSIFRNSFKGTTDKYGVDYQSLSKTRVVVIRWFFIQHPNGHIQPLRKPKIEKFGDCAPVPTRGAYNAFSHFHIFTWYNTKNLVCFKHY